MSNYMTFSFELDRRAMTHLKDKSYYNHNYYQLDLSVYGDYITPAMCDVLYEEFEEFSETYTYTLWIHIIRASTSSPEPSSNSSGLVLIIKPG